MRVCQSTEQSEKESLNELPTKTKEVETAKIKEVAAFTSNVFVDPGTSTEKNSEVEDVLIQTNKMLDTVENILKTTLKIKQAEIKLKEVNKTQTPVSQRLEEILSYGKLQKAAGQSQMSGMPSPYVKVNTQNIQKSSESGEIRSDLEKIQKVLEEERGLFKVNIKRDYKLTYKTNLNLWMDYLRAELSSNDLLDIIDPEVSAPQGFSAAMQGKRSGCVRDIIINRIDENYHKRVLDQKEPKLRNQKTRK